MIENDIKEVYFSKEELHGIVKRLGEQISKDYEGKNLTLVSILKGSVIFMADLMREITVPCEIDFMCVSSYGNGTKSSGTVKIIKDLDINLEGKDLLLVEDILDPERSRLSRILTLTLKVRIFSLSRIFSTAERLFIIYRRCSRRETRQALRFARFLTSRRDVRRTLRRIITEPSFPMSS